MNSKTSGVVLDLNSVIKLLWVELNSIIILTLGLWCDLNSVKYWVKKNQPVEGLVNLNSIMNSIIKYWKGVKTNNMRNGLTIKQNPPFLT